MADTPKTCRTCAHRNGGMRWGKCMLSGSFISTERAYPSVCGRDFAGWVSREPLAQRVRFWLIGGK